MVLGRGEGLHALVGNTCKREAVWTSGRQGDGNVGPGEFHFGPSFENKVAPPRADKAFTYRFEDHTNFRNVTATARPREPLAAGSARAGGVGSAAEHACRKGGLSCVWQAFAAATSVA